MNAIPSEEHTKDAGRQCRFCSPTSARRVKRKRRGARNRPFLPTRPSRNTMPRWFKKFKKTPTGSKHPVSSADSTHDVTTDLRPDSALDTNPDGVFRSVDLAIDSADLAIIAPTNEGHSLTPLPGREEGSQGTLKTSTTISTPSDGGGVVSKYSVNGS